MSNPRHPFRINVGFVVHEEIGYSHDFPFEFDEAPLGEDLVMTDFNGNINIGRTPQGLVTTGTFEGKVTLECARCLNDFTHKLDWEFTELFAFKSELVDENVLQLPESAQIDFGPILREYALLEVPINPLHSTDCKGLCLECGQDLNVEDCGHEDIDENSPFSELKKLL